MNWIPRWAIPVLVATAVGTVWLRLSIVRMTYAIDQSDRVIHNLLQDKEQAQVRLSALRSPRRLEALARARFGLTQPRADQVVHEVSGGH